MPREATLRSLEEALAAARVGLFFQVALEWSVRCSPWVLAPGILLVAADQFLLGGRWSLLLLACAILCLVAIPLAMAGWRVAVPFRAALAIDVRTHLKDRLSSAWEFLVEGELDAPRRAQIADALAHAEALEAAQVLNSAVLRQARLPLALALGFGLAFLVPARGSMPPDGTALALHAAQLEVLRDLRDALEEQRPEVPGAESVLEQLRRIEERFAAGEMGERDVMIALSRLEQDAAQAIAQAGVARLARELDAVSPPLASSASARSVGEAMQRREMRQAAEAMRDLAGQVRRDVLSPEEQRELAAAMQAAADALSDSSPQSQDQQAAGGQFLESTAQQEPQGQQEQQGQQGQQPDASQQRQQSMQQDLQQGAEALRSGDTQSFQGASDALVDKMGRLQQFFESQRMREQLALSRLELAQSDGQEPGSGNQGTGGEDGNRGDGAGQGGLEAGSSPAGDNRGDPGRLHTGYTEFLKVTGTAGSGSVQTETETIAGQTSASGRSAREVHSEYEAAAEQVIEREEVPLSHRLHVKKYFQGIRPQE